MPNYINTINIPSYDTAEETKTAIINALVANLGWIADDDGERIWVDASNKLGMKFVVNNSTVNCYICNNVLSPTSYCAAIARGNICCIDYINSSEENSLALGFRNATATICLSAVFSKNTNNEMLALCFYSNLLYMLKKDYASATNVYAPYSNTTANLATSLCKLPDIINGCMFSDLYFVFSCPVQLSDLVVYIGGQRYRICGNATYIKLAIPIS